LEGGGHGRLVNRFRLTLGLQQVVIQQEGEFNLQVL